MSFTPHAQFIMFSSKGKSSLHFTSHFCRDSSETGRHAGVEGLNPGSLGDDARLSTAPAMVKAAASSKAQH
jgi:hypothetical protein